MPGKVWTCSQALAWTASRLGQAGVSSSRLDAELLLGKALGCERVDLYVNPSRPLTTDERAAYRGFIQRRLAGEPVAYITGTKSFRYLTLSVTSAVLVPRPESELLVEAALKFAGGTPIVAADIGTGSGAIAVSIAKEIAGSTVYATDASKAALEVANANAEAAGVAERIRLFCGDLFDPLPGDLVGKLDLVVSNPPYVAADEFEILPREVASFEPRVALDGGPDGTDFHQRLVAGTPELLRDGGMLVMEIGAKQGMIVSDMMAGRFEDVVVHKDLAGLDRVVTGVKRAK